MELLHTFITWFDRRAKKMEKARFGLLAMYNAIQSCVGSIAVMKILQHDGNIYLLAAATGLTMASNSVFVAQGSVKLCLLLFYLSILVNNIIIFSLAMVI